MHKSVRRPVLIAIAVAMILLVVFTAAFLFRQPVRVFHHKDARPVSIIGRK